MPSTTRTPPAFDLVRALPTLELRPPTMTGYSLTGAGLTADSVVAAVQGSDLKLLRHDVVDDDGSDRGGAVYGDSLGTLVIRFSVFGTWYEVDSLWEGLFLERTLPGAYKRTIREDRDGMRVLFNHGFDMTTGDKVLGPITDLREEDDSPVGEVSLFDTAYNRELLPGLAAGVYGSSMRFRVQEERWDDEPDASDYNPKAIPERTITRAKVLEFGPVTFPANPDATAEMASAGMRSTTDDFYERLRQRDEPAYQAAVRAARALRPDFTGRPDARSAGGGDRHDDARPGNGQAPIPQAVRARDRALRIAGVIT